MLWISAQNISDMADISDYEYEVCVTTKAGRKKVLSSGVIEGHERDKGWKELMQRVIDDAKE